MTRLPGPYCHHHDRPLRLDDDGVWVCPERFCRSEISRTDYASLVLEFPEASEVRVFVPRWRGSGRPAPAA